LTTSISTNTIFNIQTNSFSIPALIGEVDH
jgi:hypothetical protein